MEKLADVIAQNGPDRNWDEQTLVQQRQIEEEIANAQAFVGEKQQLKALEAEYNEKDSAEFLKKAKELQERYPFWRRIRGDGNCFYRAVAYAQCERFLRRDSQASKESFEKFRKLANGWKDRLMILGYPKVTTEDFCDVFSEIITQLGDPKANEETLLKIFNTQGESEYIVVFMRLVTGGYLLENEATYSGFVDGARSIKQYVEQEVNPMNRECDHLCITALAKALDIPIRIEYMDRSQAPAGGWHHDFTSEEGDAPAIYFLYRPGHYDILYPKTSVAKDAS